MSFWQTARILSEINRLCFAEHTIPGNLYRDREKKIEGEVQTGNVFGYLAILVGQFSSKLHKFPTLDFLIFLISYVISYL